MTSNMPSAIMNISRATSPFLHIKSPGVNMKAFILSTKSCKNSGWHSWNMVTWNESFLHLIYHFWETFNFFLVFSLMQNCTFFKTLKLTCNASSVFNLSGNKPKAVFISPPPWIRPLKIFESSQQNLKNTINLAIRGKFWRNSGKVQKKFGRNFCRYLGKYWKI